MLTTPGITDERVTFFVAELDSTSVAARGGLDEESELIAPFVAPIDDVIAALDHGGLGNALLVSALQWLALNRARLKELLASSA